MLTVFERQTQNPIAMMVRSFDWVWIYGLALWRGFLGQCSELYTLVYYLEFSRHEPYAYYVENHFSN